MERRSASGFGKNTQHYVQHSVLHIARHIFVALVLVGAPVSALAQVTITEIMYDLEGSDSGREWVEVHNGGSDTVDLVGWRFFEGETNHKLTAVQGGTALGPGGYAVIADNAAQFLSDAAGFSGMLFDSSFSFSNTGEPLALRDSALVDADALTYTSEWGAAGDGLSLQRNGSSWIAAAPTPGVSNATVAASVPASGGGSGSGDGASGGSSSSGTGGSSASGSSSSASSGTSGGSTSGTSSIALKPQISARASGPSTVTVGAPAEFRGEAVGLKGEPIENARHIWNFGDGSSGEGRAVLHTWRHPGDYVVVLSVASGEYTATSRITVRAAAALLTISAVDEGESGFIEVTNKGAQDVDLSEWQLRVGERHFILPKNTILAVRAALRFSAETTVIGAARGEPVSLLYPNRGAAARYEWPSLEGTNTGAISIAVDTQGLVGVSSATEASSVSSRAASRAPTQSPDTQGSSRARQTSPAASNTQEGTAEGEDTALGAGLAGLGALDLPPPAAGCQGTAVAGEFFGDRLGIYLAALGGLTALGVFAFLASRRSALEAVPVSEADGYEILEK